MEATRATGSPATTPAATRKDRGLALGWLARQLAWERQLEHLRHGTRPASVRHEAA
ncbi:MAG: hypothetical protein U0V73_07930 [Acidimicrobiia bacterium]